MSIGQIDNSHYLKLVTTVLKCISYNLGEYSKIT